MATDDLDDPCNERGGSMNSRERVWKALNDEPVDRVPIDLGAMRASGISARVYAQLKERLGLDGPVKVLDAMQILAEVEPAVLEACHVDVVPLEAVNAAWCDAAAETGVAETLANGRRVWFPPGTRIRKEPDGAWVLLDAAGEPYARMPSDGLYFDFIRPTMAASRIDPAAFRPASTVPDEQLDALAKRAEDLYTNTDKAIFGWGASISFFGLSALLSDNITQGSLDEWLVMLMTEKETATEMMGRATDAAIALAERYHQAAEDKIMIWGVASDDAGTQRSGLIRPDLFEEMILPHYRRFCDWVHQNTGWKTFVHSCGAVSDYIDDWIDAGVDILNPVQISAAGMDPTTLMDRFGKRVVFWGGGCDTQHVLPLGTPEEVRAHVRANLDAFDALSGGFVFNQVHNVQADVPVENVMAMLDAAYTYGRTR
ncbi:MAG: uroporphyrinogen decarboxylase family protein [Planctomycetota bacterium]